jgi:prepilin-type N-terminal cleavage/methylation domain-containing protein
MKNILSLSFLKEQRGFSLVELVVVLALFVIVVGSAIDFFIVMIHQQRRILEQQELLSQVSYVEEYMSKALRMAAKDNSGSCLGGTNQGDMYVLTHCNGGSLQACSGIKFINQSDGNACQEFFLDDTTSTLQQMRNGAAAQRILSDKFTVQSAKFIINGDKTVRQASESDTIQPRVTFLLDIFTQTPGNQQEKRIQTTVSARNLNIP